MRKVILSSLVVASVAFGGEDVVKYADNFNPFADGVLNLGAVLELDSDKVIGYAYCTKDGQYAIDFATYNSNVDKTGEYTKVYKLPEEFKDACKTILDSGSKITRNFDTKSVPGCMLIESTATNNNGSVKYNEYGCYNKDPYRPFGVKVPSVKEYNGEDAGAYAGSVMNDIQKWNTDHNTRYNYLWEDHGENRDRYTVEGLKKRAIKSDMLGDYVDSDGNLLYTIYVENNKLAYLVDGKKYYIDAATLKKNPRLAAAGNLYYNSHYGKDKADFKVETRYYCLDSETGSEGSDAASFGYAVTIVNNHEVEKRIVTNAEAGGRVKFGCYRDSIGLPMTKDMVNEMTYAGRNFLKPAVPTKIKRDKSESKDVDISKLETESATVAQPEQNTANLSPKDKIVALLKNATIPGIKIDEKGRYLGEVGGYGEGKATITLPNEEEIEFAPSEAFNALAADYKDYVKDMENGSFFYACDTPTMEKADKNSPLFGYAYIIYNGHAISSVPAYVNGSFKCDKSLINKELNQAQFYKLYEQSFSKLKSHPAVAKKM